MVSIIMATFNRAATLPRAIASVLGQSHSDLELIIVDDGSTDSTADILRRLDDPRVRSFALPSNRGVCAAKNAGLEQIRGDWFTILDSDDEIVPDALSAMLECAQRTGATAVTCNCRDSVTGLLTGLGPTSDRRLSPEATARCRGEFWGLTRTCLLGDLRFDERLPGLDPSVWVLINRRARRYYLHRPLRVYHTEGADRVTKVNRAGSFRRKVATHVALGENRAYLGELWRVDRRMFVRTYARVLVARSLRPFLARSL